MTTLPVYAPALARTATVAQTRFLIRHLWLPLAGVLVLSVLLMAPAATSGLPMRYIAWKVGSGCSRTTGLPAA